MRIVQTLAGRQVLSIVGQQGVGKSSIGDAVHQAVPDSSRIEISDVVKRVHGTKPRAELSLTREHTLTDPSWLGTAVAERILEDGASLCVVTGVREIEVHNTLVDFGCSIIAVSISAEMELRYMRVKALGKCDSKEAFYQQDRRELAMGLDIVLQMTSIKLWSTEETTIPAFVSEILNRVVWQNV